MYLIHVSSLPHRLGPLGLHPRFPLEMNSVIDAPSFNGTTSSAARL
jgi:hypothetical protein